jgi:hypothetical protein
MATTVRKTAITVAALGAIGLGGAAIAGAAGNSSGSPMTQPRPQREQLSSDAAAKVKAAALAKVPGASVVRTEAGGPYGTPYHAHIRTSDGKLQVVLVDSSFSATAVQDDQARGGKGRGGRGHGETALTGDTKTRVETAVLARYAGARIMRTETNDDSNAPYESHIQTADGKQLEVLVSKDFKVLDARERPARP